MVVLLLFYHLSPADNRCRVLGRLSYEEHDVLILYIKVQAMHFTAPVGIIYSVCELSMALHRREELWNVHLLIAEFECPEVTL